MFDKVLVANRGEIAVRIFRALRELGLAGVAVYSDADRDALHVRVADEAYHVGPPPASESYLDMMRLLDVARRSGAGAVHPGYGFLAESAPFARAVEEAGLVWIGPRPEAIEAMGSKVESRRIMAGAGVPITPGTEDPIHSPKEVLVFAERHGYPVAVKASAGGGGKGFAVARGEGGGRGRVRAGEPGGEAYFGDGSVYVERYLPGPRHVEIQILRDKKGNAVHLGERDCSIQRRHQKLVEECPSPAIDGAMREAMGRAAVEAAAAVDYDSVGTVEFLVQDEEFFFLEMNTRVQVEHPVTEEVMGVDVVKAGINIALGEGLPVSQDEVGPRGHAIEVRLNAEDPASDFAPSPGEVTLYAEPGGPGIRVDSALGGPGSVPEYYDPLFAKLIARGADRDEAIARLRRALAEFRVEGIATTLPFHRALLEDEVFLSGRYTTGFVADRLQSMELASPVPAGPTREPEGEAREVAVEVDGKLFRVKVFSGAEEDRRAPRRKAARTDRAAAGEGQVVAPMQGTIVKVLVGGGSQVAADEPVCVLEAMKMESEIRTRKAGTVARVSVVAGQTVKAGEPLVTVE